MMGTSSGRVAKWPIYLGLLAFALWFGYLALALTTTSPAWLPEWLKLPMTEADSIVERRGQFGDAFGAFNALVSTFALIGLFYTIRAQQEQLATQVSIGASNDLLVRQQQFQDQFYRSIDIYRDLLREITVTDASGNRYQAREALHMMFRKEFVASIEATGGSDFHQALRRQLEAYDDERLGRWSSWSAANEALERLLTSFSVNESELQAAVESIGTAWRPVYLANRFQLDSLFRAWYTTYRILDSSEKYMIEPAQRALYSAIFRAQLSWIEMALLLVNQSGLPGNERFPKACRYSNEFVVFDNLDTSHDVVIGLLSFIAHRVRDSDDRTPTTLTAKAFGQPLSTLQT